MGKKEMNILGGSLELALRFMLLLDVCDEKCIPTTRLCCLDFISTYAGDFGLDEGNLHGYSNYRYSEFVSRQIVAGDAVRRLVLRGYVDVNTNETGFAYSLTSTGSEACKALDNDYVSDYSSIAGHVSHALSGKSDKDLMAMIHKHALDDHQ